MSRRPVVLARPEEGETKEEFKARFKAQLWLALQAARQDRDESGTDPLRPSGDPEKPER